MAVLEFCVTRITEKKKKKKNKKIIIIICPAIFGEGKTPN